MGKKQTALFVEEKQAKFRMQILTCNFQLKSNCFFQNQAFHEILEQPNTDGLL